MREPVVRHHTAQYDDDHRVRVDPEKRREDGRALCADCGRLARARWVGEGHAARLEEVQE